MASKVTCTCGWSWNKSDSSKKDVYICHQCGKDNTMKDGGWLSKYNIPKAQKGKVAKYNPLDGEYVLDADGAIQTLSNVGEVMSASQKGVVKAITGKYQEPAEAMNITNPYAKFAVNAVMDPLNIFGIGLLGKAGKAAKATSAIKKGTSELSKAIKPNIQFNGVLKHEVGDIQYILDNLRTKGSKLDNDLSQSGISGKDLLHSDLIQYHGTYSGRPIVEVKMPDGTSEHFYKSSGWAGKEGAGANGTTEGMWQVYGGHANQPNTPNWFIKDANYQNYYGSDTFRSMAENMDNALINKYKLKDVNELDGAFNFRNRNANVDSVTPKSYKQNGGWLSKYNIPKAQNGIEGTMDGLTDKGFNYNGAWGGTMQTGGKTFLEPTSEKLPLGYMPPSIIPSSEVAISIGGVGDEPAYLIPSFKYGQRLKDPIGEFDRTGEHLGGPFKTYQEADEWERTVRHPYVEKGQSIPSPYRRWGKDYDMGKGEFMQMGGSIPGSVGFTYARTQDPAPSNGPYAKKTKASAQNGQEMKFYQEGLDWKPKNISKNGGWLSKYEDGGIIEDDRGQWEYPGEITKINSNQITMQGVDYPVLGISDTGDTQMMQPGQDYTYEGKSVTEIPMAQNGYSEPDYVTGTTRRSMNKMIGMGNYLMPASALNTAADLAKSKGLDYGELTSGPADAVRHTAASASVASKLPIPKFIGDYSPNLERALRIAGANILGGGYELMNPNNEGLLMDIKNNYQGSLIGSIPGLSQNDRNKMIVNQLQKGKLTVDNPKKPKKENGGWLSKYN